MRNGRSGVLSTGYVSPSGTLVVPGRGRIREEFICPSSRMNYHPPMSQPELFPESTEAAKAEARMIKHVNAVALMPIKGGGKISVFERKLYNILLHQAQRQGDRAEYSARMPEIIKQCRFDSNNTAHIKKSLTNLIKTIVEWQSPSTNESVEVWDACGLLSGASIKKDKLTQGITLEWRFDTKIKQQLLSPDRYARLMLESVTQLRSHPALALYEICARYVDNPSHKTARQHWRWWRPVLTGQAHDIEKGEYRYFKRDVLQPAIAEINANTELDVRLLPELREADKKTVSIIQFEVNLKAASAVIAPSRQPKQVAVQHLPIIGEMIKAGIPQVEAERLLHEVGAQGIEEGLATLERRRAMSSDKIGPVENPARYLRSIVRSAGPAPTLSLGSAVDSGVEQVRVHKELERNKTALHEEWLRRKKDTLRSLFQESPAGDQESLLKQFRATLTSQPVVKRLDTNGWNHRMVRDSFASFLGQTWDGPEWNTPKPDDILALALERAPQSQQ